MPKDQISMWYALKEKAKKAGKTSQYNYFDKKIKAYEKGKRN